MAIKFVTIAENEGTMKTHHAVEIDNDKVLPLDKKQGKGTMSVQEVSSGKAYAEVSSEQNVGDPIITNQPLANVGITLGYTKNLGNYEAAKVSVSCHMPCTPTVAGVDEMFTQVESWANKKMEEIVAELGEG